ncbi:MAG: reverse transcriptase domain-containing protein [Treponema sp.]|nr:reverse transcriptase domain-containing protein [Treponema sp.]
MSILEELGIHKKWQDFFAYKTQKSHLSKKEEAFLRNFIENEQYKAITDNILKTDFCFSIPAKRFLNKHGKGKKRVVYTFSERENTVLKLISHLLYRYDNAQPYNCYSFRRNYGAKKAIAAITKQKDIVKKYSCKLDIKDYFNSIDVELLLPILNKLLFDDKPAFCFLEKLLTADKALFNNRIITEKRGAMAGIPVSQFFANIYLAEMDNFFLNAGILYARYSDDIIFFADNNELLAQHLKTVKEYLAKYHLELNPEKVKITAPNEKWDYLGIAFDNGRIVLSESTMKKIKGKIRRKARSIYRWKIRKNADAKKAMSVFSRAINRKFFGKGEEDEFTWTRWFFPLITADNDLKTIDAYVQEYMRYVKSGQFNKANYRMQYSDLKNCGYISLVNKYHNRTFTLKNTGK